MVGSNPYFQNCRWPSVGALALAQSDRHHFQEAAFDFAKVIGMRLDAVHNHDTVGLPGVAVRINIEPLRCLPHHDRFHRRANLGADFRFGNSILSQNLELAFGGGSPMTAHGGNTKGCAPRSFNQPQMVRTIS